MAPIWVPKARTWQMVHMYLLINIFYLPNKDAARISVLTQIITGVVPITTNTSMERDCRKPCTGTFGGCISQRHDQYPQLLEIDHAREN